MVYLIFYLSDYAVSIENGNFAWNKDTNATLQR